MGNGLMGIFFEMLRIFSKNKENKSYILENIVKLILLGCTASGTFLFPEI